MTDPKPNNGNSHVDYKTEFLASIVVFLVALPLCMGIAIASGVPVAAGLITGIIGGLIVGVFAGCPLQVSGPAAGLTVIVYEIVQRFGLEMLGIIVLLAGALQLTAGLLRLGQWFRAVSPAVIKGMLAGIGVLIFASQFHVMVDDKPKGSGLANLLTIPSAIGKGFTWPDFASHELRQFRTDTLREVGELHRRQAALANHVAERLPDHATPEQLASESPEDVARETADLKKLLPEQEAISEHLAEVVARLEGFELRGHNGEKSQAILAAATLALEKTRAATDDLKVGHIRTALKSQNEAIASLDELSASLKNHSLAAQIGLLTILAILLWQGLAPKKVKLIPAPLIAVLLAAIVAALLTIPVLYVEVPTNLWDEIRLPTWAILSDVPWVGVLQAAAVVAAVASAETLLCATAVDQMHQGPRTKYDKELAAQGVGNMLCGLVGALPMTGVIVRSTANVQSGAKTRLSAVLHGLWLLIFVAGLAFLLRMIPTAALAAILVYTGYKLVNPKSIKQLYQYGWGEVGIYVATVVMIVVTDLLTGVIVGVALSAAKLLYTFSHLHVKLESQERDRAAVLKLAGSATFLRLPRLASALEDVPANAELHVDFQHLDYIDHACLDLLMTWARQHESTGGRLVIDWESLHARFRAENGNNQLDTPAADNGDSRLNGAAKAKSTAANN